MSRKAWIPLLIVVAVVLAVALVWRGRGGSDARARDPGGGSGGKAAGTGGGGGAPARLEPAAAEGRVVDAAGKPIAGAVVRLARERGGGAGGDGGPRMVTAQSGADGAWAIEGLAPGAYAATAAAQGFVPESHEAVALVGGERARIDFTLQPGGAAVTGVVTDATGGPVAGAVVELSPVSGILSARAAHAAAAITGADGRYRLHVREGRHRAGASHPDYVSSARHVEIGGGGASVDFTLVPGGAIEGVVRSSVDGKPVAGARVRYDREAVTGLPGGGGLQVGRGGGVVVSGADGSFRVTGLEPGAIRLVARARGLASAEPALVPLGVAEQVTGVEVWVGAASSVTGVVRVEGGGSAAGIEVAAFGMGGPGEGGGGGVATCDAEGRFEIDGLVPGRYGLSASGEGVLPSMPTPVKVAEKPTSGVTLTVRKGVAVRGRVEPAEVAEVRLEPIESGGGGAGAPGGLLGGIGAGGGSIMLSSTSALARPDGSFTLAPVAPGKQRIAARAADGRRGVVEIDVGASGADGVVIRLEDGASIAGRVVDDKGKPVHGALVSVRRAPEQQGRRVTMIVNGLDVGADRAPTAADGTFLLKGLAAGEYELSVLEDRGAPMRFAKGAADEPVLMTLAEKQQKRGVELVVDRNDGVIRGVVIGADGKPMADAWVSAVSDLGLPALAAGPRAAPRRPGPGPGPGPGAASDRGAGGGGGERVQAMVMITEEAEEDGDDGGGGLPGAVPPVLTDAEGRFEIRGLAAGNYRLLGEGGRGAERGSLDGVEPDGAAVTLRLAALTQLSGKVTAGGKPVGEFTVELVGPAQRRQRFREADGRFLMARVEPGDYEVTVSASEGTGKAKISVAAGRPATVEVALLGNGKVIGKAVGADGKPLAGMPIVAAAMAEGGAVMVSIDGEPDRTGPDGSFELSVAPGRHMLLVLGPAGPAARKPIQVDPGQTLDVGVLTASAEPPGGAGPPAAPGP